jgi:lipopolysaccharide/colanic/teichoic acid biosynthesis glycosyltransferase
MTWLVVERPGVKLYKPYYQILRRTIDVATCLVLSALLAPIFIIIAIAIELDTKGPIFFIQERVGKGGRRFRMFKFRTMHQSLDTSDHEAYMRAFVNGETGKNGSSKSTYKPFQNSHLTRVGRILRKTSLDELPQIINVLKGEMSLIGPRPNVPWEVEEYHGWHKERLEVLPGISGLAQVRGRSGISFDSIVKYDIEYIEKQSLKLDLQIMWWTVLSVIDGHGAE